MTFALRWAGLPLLVVVASCTTAPAETESTARARQAILGGTPSDGDQDAVVMLLQIDPRTNRRVGICTGAMLAPRLVLTARHCVAAVKDPETLACNADGTPLLGGEITGNVDPSNLFVFTGSRRPEHIGFEPPELDTTRWKPAGKGLEIIDDRATSLCDHDLALLLLESPIEGVPLATVRLDRPTAAGEKLVTVGWGVSSGEQEPRQRQQRRDVVVKRIGPSSEIPVLTTRELLFDESICLGDSGGPVFAQETNAIVGVVSRGGNGASPDANLAATCVDADNLATQLAPFRDLVLDAYRRAGAEPRLEPEAEDEGCSAARRPGRAGPPAWALVVVIAAAVGRRLSERRRRA
jgi:hypothetical protein